VATSSRISPALRAQLSLDVAAVAYLVGQIKQFFSAVSSGPGAETDQIAQSAEQYFAWTKTSWERTNGTSLGNLREVDAAETFVVGFFTPLLEAKQLADQLTDPTIFGAAALLEVPSSGPSLQPTGALTQVSFTGPPIPNFLLVYAGVFTRFHDLLVSQGLPLNAADAVASFTMGTFLICSFPVWTIYHELHGLMAFERVRQRLQDSIDACQTARDSLLSDVLATPRPTATTDPAYTVSSLFGILDTSLRKKRDDYLPTFAAQCQQLNAQRIKLKADELGTELKSEGFWAEGTGKKTVVNFGKIPSGTPAANILNYIGEVRYAATEAGQERSFWAPRPTWTLLTKAARLISQAGFHTYVTAVDNPYGGRHPPHLTHRDGFEVDLVWTVTSDPADTTKPLAQSQLNYGSGIFFDVNRQRYFDVAPVNKNQHFESVSHSGLAMLATRVALQAIALAGFARYLYLDFLNMRWAAQDLGLVIDKSLDPFSGGQGNIPVVEGMGHYNHLHIEAPGAGEKAGNFFTRRVLTIIYHLALLRDQDNDFLNTMFEPPDVSVFATPAQQHKASEFQGRWLAASSHGQPSLLPVWVSAEVRDRLQGGEKIGQVLGIKT
jgi:hypothetical protein